MGSVKTGILEEKLKTYYADTNTASYRDLLIEAIQSYSGKEFRKILDIGSGVGSFEDAIKPFGYEMYCIDASDYGTQTCRQKGYKCEQVILKKGVPIPHNDSMFSFIIMNQVIEHMSKEDGQYYISEIVRLLEPGGVAIIKSPSRYSRIWHTDPNHIYCWKPNELKSEVATHTSQLSKIVLQRTPLEPWMSFKYNEEIIEYWHKYNRSPIIKRTVYLFMKLLDKVWFKMTGSDRLLAGANIQFVKK